MKYSFDELTATKPIEAYTEEQIKNIKLLSADKDEATPFGSATYRIQKYPGDLDLHEVFEGCCSINAVIKKFQKIIVKIAKNIKKDRLHYFSEFKAGLDNRYDIDIGEINLGNFNINRYEVEQRSNELFDDGLLNKNEMNIIYQILETKNPNGNDYDVLYHIFRERKILRWTLKEVIRGFKILPGNIHMTLFDALHAKTHVKIDMITLVNNLIVEITNFWILVEHDPDGTLKMINLDYNYLDRQEANKKYDEQIKEEIEKLYYSDMHYSPFKMVKRMWAYSRAFGLEPTVRILLPLVSGNISYLYQLKSEVDTILRLYELNKVPLKTINKQMDLMKQKLSNILEIQKEDLLLVYQLIDQFIQSNSNSLKIKLLKIIKKYFVDNINIHTITTLNILHYNPPPREFLPKHLKYAQILRHPYDVVINPMEKFVLGGESCLCGCRLQGGCECGCLINP
jgi:hypothetical protein